MADPVRRRPSVEAEDPLLQRDQPASQNPQKAVKHGRAWTWAGSATIATSAVALTASILIICTLTTGLGNSFTKMGPGGAKMVTYMGQHANGFMIGGLAGSAVSLVGIGLGVAFLYVGCRDARQARREAELERRHQDEVRQLNEQLDAEKAKNVVKKTDAADSPPPSRDPSPLRKPPAQQPLVVAATGVPVKEEQDANPLGAQPAAARTDIPPAAAPAVAKDDPRRTPSPKRDIPELKPAAT